jgi:hypothetical protein
MASPLFFAGKHRGSTAPETGPLFDYATLRLLRQLRHWSDSRPRSFPQIGRVLTHWPVGCRFRHRRSCYCYSRYSCYTSKRKRSQLEGWMAGVKIDADVFAQWEPASKVAEEIAGLGSHIAGINALADRLRTGLASGGAEHRTLQLRNPETGPLEIPQYHWPADGLFQNDLWQTGQLTIFARQRSAPYEQERYDYYGVRFDPAGVDALWAAAGRRRVSEPTGEAADQAATTKGGPPLHDRHLNAWAAVFRAAYPNGSEGQAAVSVAGCFPDKSVTRVRLRAALEKVGKLAEGRPRKA